MSPCPARPEENPTIGLFLCKEKKDAVVKLTYAVCRCANCVLFGAC